MNLRAINHWKAAVISFKRQEQISPAQNNRIHMLVVIELAPNCEEQCPLLLRCITAGRESDIGIMSGFEALPCGYYDFYVGHLV